MSLTSYGHSLVSSIHIQRGKTRLGKRRERIVLVLTRLSGLGVPALQVGLQEGTVHEGFIAEVALEKGGEKSAEGL